MARHRRDDDEFAAADPTVVLPAVVPADQDVGLDIGVDTGEELRSDTGRGVRRGGRTVSPLLVGAGGVALTLVLVVGGWALAGGHSDGGDPLVYPWSSESPGPIDLSVSFEPTVLPSPTVVPSSSPSSAGPRPTRSRSASPSPSVSPSPSTESITSGISARVFDSRVWQDGFVVHFAVTNKTAVAAGWQVKIVYSAAVVIDQPWNAKVDTRTGTTMTFTADQPLAAGQSIDFGFVAYRTRGADLGLPVTCAIDGKQFPCSLT
ncbi:MAG: hypothetical protein HOV77_32750 [Hamadaea sp.]|uniref:cellulose binding domain-containing protein n=1 Tax=Hamadaea sp. TaxID=2024425 RepID=UPI00185DB15B|nr:cellulose binding domain-containing protein [Hamadaea sp.]NUT23958.1 hypothetical protein [Hamadaea sp.]